MTFRLLLIEDSRARAWAPFALTRPVGEILFGALLLRERTETALGVRAEGVLGAPELHGFDEEGAPPVFGEEGEPAPDGIRVVLSSRAVLPSGDDALRAIRDALADGGPRDPVPITIEGEPAGWLLPDGSPMPDPAGEPAAGPGGAPEAGTGGHPSAPGTLGGHPPPAGTLGSPPPSPGPLALPGRMLDAPWTLVAENAARLARDLSRGPPAGSASVPDLPGVWQLGEHPTTAGDGVRIDPHVVLDAREGPIHLAAGVRVEPFTHLVGPAFIGAGSVLLGGGLGPLSTGPVCKLRGEVRDCVVLGYVNKAHDGHLGHALVGRWVNLGAFTTNSDLKNNYGPVRVPTGADHVVDTGRLKVGAFLGDHVKTGIGTLIGTGTVVGAGSNVFGGALPPTWVPPFSWGVGADLGAFRLDAFLETAERAMARRDVVLSDGMRRLLTRAWERARGEGAAS